MIAHVQGASGTVTSIGNPSCTLTVTAGNALVMSFATIRPNIFTGSSLMPVVTDDKGNVWLPVGTSAGVVHYTGTNDDPAWETITFIALNCAGGSTTVTVSSGWLGLLGVMTLDEYSGVASVKAVDQVTLASTAYASGLTTIDSGSITLSGNQLLYSIGFDTILNDTITASVGFTSRQSASISNGGFAVTLTSFDKNVSGGVYNNVINSGGAVDTLQVFMFSLSENPVDSPVVQIGCSTINSTFGTSISTTYPMDNTAGNTLIAFGTVSDGSDYTVTDSQGNTWQQSGVTGTGGDVTIMAFALNCKAGPNTVTVNSATGGSDNSVAMIVAEYDDPNMAFTSANYNIEPSGNVISTGTVAVSGPSRLISGMWDFANNHGFDNAVAQLGKRRFQFCNMGFLNISPQTLVLADQFETVPGNYENTFTLSTGGIMRAPILGFSLSSPAAPAQLHVFVVT